MLDRSFSKHSISLFSGGVVVEIPSYYINSLSMSMIVYGS